MKRLLLLLTIGAAACGPGAPLETAPATLGGLALHHEFGGERARQAVARLHQGGDAGVDSAWIAHYGADEPSAILYVGIAADPSTADQLIRAMEEGITTRRTPFEYSRRTTVGDRVIHQLQGQGQQHFVFAMGRKAVWLSADPAVARRALAEALGLAADHPALNAMMEAATGATGNVVVAGLGPLARHLVDAEIMDINVWNVTKVYNERVRALERVRLTVGRGEWLALMGPSGSGKTTLLNLIACLDRPTSGRLLVAGTDVTTLATGAAARFRREHVGLVFQQFHLVPYLTAVENVMLAQYFHSMAERTDALAALERVGLEERAGHLPSQLSGGEKQRVCIARALINEPDLLLVDEPTGNLDATNEENVMRLLRELHTAGHTLVMVTHDPAIAGNADRLVRLDHGRVAAVPGRPDGSRSTSTSKVLRSLYQSEAQTP
jgi:putative ABC transport system ATP-binding protein